MGTGYLTVIANMANNSVPVVGAEVLVKDNAGNVMHRLITDESGKTQEVSLFAPDKINTFNPFYKGDYYSTYRVDIKAPGLVSEIINGVQIFDGIHSVEESDMLPITTGTPSYNIINIPAHELSYVPGRKQSVRRPPDPPASPRRQVIIPDFITVHLGRYDNPSARNIRVPFPLYVKNVTSSEIFPTWPNASIEANIRAIINFALNRVYTEWYRTRGQNYDITNSTATDMAFVEGRDIFTNIGNHVDRILGDYLKRPAHNEPFFTEFCNGTTSTCRGMSQWGTVSLANNGQNPLQILRHYYPSDLNLYPAPIAGVTESFPGVNLSQGTQGPDVEIMQKYLNRIRQNYPAIPVISNPNGIFGIDTYNSVKTFQKVFDSPQTGVVDRATWNKIVRYYVAVTKLAELTSEGDKVVTGTLPPNTTISFGAKGGLVTRLQFMITFIAQAYPEIPELFMDGNFGSGTRAAVMDFQRRFQLPVDGVVGPSTWNKLYEVYHAVRNTLPPTGPPVTPPPPGITPPYPGSPLTVGSRGENVAIMQRYLTALNAVYPSIPRLASDGIFGLATQNAVRAFQSQFGLLVDGIIGPTTWNAIITQFNNISAAPPYPGTPLRQGSTGENVRILQTHLNRLAATNPSIPRVTADGVFGPLTRNSVIAAQRALGLVADGIVGPVSWAAIVR